MAECRSGNHFLLDVAGDEQRWPSTSCKAHSTHVCSVSTPQEPLPADLGHLRASHKTSSTISTHSLDCLSRPLPQDNDNASPSSFAGRRPTSLTAWYNCERPTKPPPPRHRIARPARASSCTFSLPTHAAHAPGAPPINGSRAAHPLSLSQANFCPHTATPRVHGADSRTPILNLRISFRPQTLAALVDGPAHAPPTAVTVPAFITKRSLSSSSSAPSAARACT
ncbi:hypothetical protein B0H16DRAFT_1884375 [Mycena metata]|uniref:Uncharacterized protein n=1 Tax=Mycena metata TaxID=1033252 RepID=A0AAD7JAT8_9AGAR|nr:hypothetical protein B0H16DRAFT_1884375 [Mycena metata]